jgi:RNA polymerase sigma-70 factor (ECF subfamily)
MEVNERLSEKGQRDFHLVQRALNESDQKAYAELLYYYRDSLYFLMMKMTNNATDAEDLTIEAFGKAFKKLDQYTSDYAFSTWLFRIAANNCIDFIRRKRKDALNQSSDIDIDFSSNFARKTASTGLDPEENIINDQKIRLMRGVVEKLKPHYRQLVELRYFEEMSYDEISVQLQLPLGTVKAQLFRARELLYQILKNSKEKL